MNQNDQQHYNLYKTLSENLGHIPLKIESNQDGITWKIEAQNFIDFYEMSSLQEVHESMNLI